MSSTYRSLRSKRKFSHRKSLSRSAKALIWLIILAVIIGIAIGLLLPKFNRTAAQLTGEYESSGQAADVLRTLKVSKPHRSGYDRTLFGYRSTDVDGNGCDVREDVLARDLVNVRFRYAGSCQVRSGLLHDPYTGLDIQFVRGRKTSSLVQIDHVVALENAWQSGAWHWSKSKRISFGNDMLNLLAVQGKANEDKGSASAAYWLPSNKKFRCDYVARQIAVKSKYSLSVTDEEKRSMALILHNCNAQKLPEK